MDRKLDAGALLVAAAALLLTVSLFLDWFGVGGAGVTAWQAFEVLDLVLLATAGLAVAAAFGALAARVLVGAAAVALVVVVSQLIQAPPAGQGAGIEVGAWLALVAAFGLAGGAALASAQIAVTVDVQGRERRRRVAAVDRRGEHAREDEEPAPPGERARSRRVDGEEPEDGSERGATPPVNTDQPESDGAATAVDRFAPQDEATQSTQAFDAAPETPER